MSCSFVAPVIVDNFGFTDSVGIDDSLGFVGTFVFVCSFGILGKKMEFLDLNRLASICVFDIITFFDFHLESIEWN